MRSFKKSLKVEQFQGNYLKSSIPCITISSDPRIEFSAHITQCFFNIKRFFREF